MWAALHLAYEALAVREVEVERARRRLERLGRAANDDGDGAALLGEDGVEGLAVRGADAEAQQDLAEKRYVEVHAERYLHQSKLVSRSISQRSWSKARSPGARGSQENSCRSYSPR